MADLSLDTLDGAMASHAIIQGWSITRCATVTSIDLGDDFTFGQLISAALAVVITAVGDRGSSCPGITAATYLESFAPEVISANAVKVRIIYKGYPSLQIEMSGSLNQVESNLDAQGKVITVQHTYPASYPLNPILAGKTVMQGGIISRQLGEITITFKFYVTSLEAATSFGLLEGKTNDDDYPVGAIDGAKHTWLIMSVRANSPDGVVYLVCLTMQYREQTWDPQVTFIAFDGLPPANSVKGTEFKTVTGPTETSYPTFSQPPN